MKLKVIINPGTPMEYKLFDSFILGDRLTFTDPSGNPLVDIYVLGDEYEDTAQAMYRCGYWLAGPPYDA